MLEFLQLDQQALVANIDMQRKVDLAGAEIVRPQERVRQRRPAKVHEGSSQFRATESTAFASAHVSSLNSQYCSICSSVSMRASPSLRNLLYQSTVQRS